MPAKRIYQVKKAHNGWRLRVCARVSDISTCSVLGQELLPPNQKKKKKIRPTNK